ncbi:BAH and coiled-coil domain-containing protein 1-like isoform X3 [Tachypleus tridentatus]|uniref:BAH and coiled-coil domain-containing protein 1-like isoform X3 n=1 Tax=Tachypleus tridentatus TaxID=6853 RepID=UPI003FD40AED
MKKKPNTKVKRSNLKLQVEKVSETFCEHQTEKMPARQEVFNVANDCRIPNTNKTLESISASTPDDTATKSFKRKDRTETKTTESEPDFYKQRTKSPSNKQASFKLQSTKAKKNQNKRSNENKNPFPMSKQESFSSDSYVTEDPHEELVTHVNISHTTPEKDTKRKLKMGESECNTSDTEVSSAKKRKPGRPKKHSLSKSDEATETIVPKQPKKLAFLKAEAKRVKNSLNKTKNCVELESVASFFEENIWFRRRSERIFLHDAGVVPGAISLWQGENLDKINEKNLSTTETKKSEPQPESKSETASKIPRNVNKSGEVSHKKKTKMRKDPESTSKKLKTKIKESNKQQTKEKLVPDELFAALKKCRLSESNQGCVIPHHSIDQENAESSEGDNLPLSALIEKTSNPVIRSSILQPEELDDHLRVLTMDNGLFYAGTIKAIRAPDVYGITRDGERGNRPHIYSREEILKEAIVEVKPNSLSNLPEGQRICAFWSQQYRCMYPGTVAKSSSPNCDSDRGTVYVEFDDGDSGRIPLKDICMLPSDYPIVFDSNPLMLLGKRRQHRLSGESVTDSSVNTLATSGEKVKTKKNKNKSKSGKKKNCISQEQNTQDHSQLSDVLHLVNVSSVISTVESQNTLYTIDTTATKSVKSSPEKEKEKSSQKKKSKKSKSESKSKVKDKSREKELHHLGSSSEASVCGPPSLKSRKHKKHKDDHKHRHRHHHHHCHHHHHHKKHKHDKRSHPSSPEHSHSPSSSSSDANMPNVTPMTFEQSTKREEEKTEESPQTETFSSSTENKKSQLMVKIRTNSTDISQEDKKENNEKEINKTADPESSSFSSSDSSESLHITNDKQTTKATYVTEEKSHSKKVKTKKSSEKKKRKHRLPSVEKSKIAAFLPAQQLWRWAGKSFRRANTKGKAKKEFYKAITRGKETIKVGDCAVFLSTGRPHLPYIGRIKTMWQSWGGNMVVKVKWFYHPEETKRGSQLLETKGALFQSPHMDENDVQTISHRCELLSWTEYKARRIAETSNENFQYGSIFDNNDIYYLAGSYDPLTATLSLEEGVS